MRMLFLALLFIFLPPALLQAEDLSGPAARQALCLTPETKEVPPTEAQGYCPDCYKSSTAGEAVQSTQVQAQEIQSKALVDRDLQFYRSFSQAVVNYGLASIEVYKSAAVTSQSQVQAIKIQGLSGEDRLVYLEFKNSLESLQQNPYSAEKKYGYAKISSQLKEILQKQIERCEKAKAEITPEIFNIYKSQFSSSGAKFKMALERIQELDSMIETTAPEISKEILFLINNHPTLVPLVQDEDFKFLDKEIKENAEKVKFMEEAAEKAAQVKGSPGEMKFFEDQVRAFLNRVGIEENLCGMTLAEQWALRYYTSSGYAEINRALRTDPVTENYKLYRDVLNSALKKLKTYQGDVVRGALLPDFVLSQHKVGETLIYEAYTSTSKNPSWGGTHSFVIKSKTGHFIAPLSSYRGENEVLFAAGTKFKVLSVEPQSLPVDGDSEAMVALKKKNLKIVMEEVD